MKPPKNKKKHYHKTDSNSDSDSDTPLVEIQNSRCMNTLYQPSVEKCEFCDKVCNNKYNMLVHNAKHIIIPLLNQDLHKCSQCQRHFNTIESLEWHSINSHAQISDEKDYLPKILQSFVKREPVMLLTKEPLFNNISNTINGESTQIMNGECNSQVNGEQVPDILQSLVLKEPVTMLTKLDPIITRNENILQSFVKREPVTLVKKETFNVQDCSITIIDSDDEDTSIKKELDYDYITNGSDGENSRNPKIKDRIRFEDEDDEILHLNSLMNVPSSVNGEIKEKVTLNRKNNAIILGNKPRKTTPSELEYISTISSESVHNDELKKPGMYRCKKCSTSFPNRYDAIIHETSHLSFKLRLPFLCRYCDWYVATNPHALLSHKKRKHPDLEDEHPKKKLHKCEDCGLTYTNIIKHRHNYHYEHTWGYQYDCERTEKLQTKYEDTEQIVGPEQVMWWIRTVKVCGFCYRWFKERSNLKYQYIKNYYKLGERTACERCEKPFFELLMVRMRMRKGKKDPMKYVVREDYFDVKRPKKPITNTVRLKNVQQRLKKMKFLNKF